VLRGKRAMPSWQGALTMEQIENLWAYVRAHVYE
jgi:mono/diheme cytochrome c family protein